MQLLVVALAIQAGLCAADTHVLKERFFPAREWVQQDRASPDEPLELRIALKPGNFPELERQIYAVSDPASSRYGDHLSKDRVDELIAPVASALDDVNAWLGSHGFDVDSLVRSAAKDWVRVTTTVQKAEEMLNTKYHVWQHSATGKAAVRTSEWSVPAHLAEHIALVHPTTMFPSLRPLRATYTWSSDEQIADIDSLHTTALQPAGNVDASCNTTITPTCLKELYNATDYTPQAADKGNKIAITSYLEQYANIQDLQSFYQKFAPQAAGSKFKLFSVNGGLNNQTLDEAGEEANLDTQYAFSLTFPTPQFVYTTGGSPPFIQDAHTPNNTNEPYLDFLEFALPQQHLPQTISTSYGDDEQSVPKSYADVVCGGLAALGARGVSMIFSSGDFGVGDGISDPATQTCFTNDGTNQTKFIPVFPATCPYVTSVGGTVNVPERAVTRFGSGGGFSDYFSRPWYQDDAVKPYVEALGDTYEGLYNPAGRGFPDVAAQGDRFAIFWEGNMRLIGGTSAAAPTFAGIISLVNGARIAAGQSPLGFLNPWIYSARVKGTFNDITVGNNPGCGTQGFNCTQGWDPVTGLGTPNFGLLKELALEH